MSKNNSNFNQAVWLGISSFCSFSLAIVSAAILSRYFSKTEYGTYKQILYIYSALQVIFTAGLPKVFAYFLPRLNMGQGKRMVNRINLLFILLGAIFSILLYFSSDFIASLLKNPELSVGLRLFSPFPLFTIPTIGVEGIYTALRKTKYLTIYTILNKIFMLSCLVLPVIYIRNSYQTAIIGWGVASFLTFIVAMYMKNRPYFGIKSETIPNMYKSLFRYSIPLMGAGIIGMFIQAANQFFISRYYGTIAFAEFSNGFIQLPFVSMIASSVGAVLLPIFSKASSEKNIEGVLNSYKNAVEKSAIILYPILLFCMFFAKEILTILYGSQYSTSALYFQIAMTESFISIFPFMSVMLAIGKSNIYFWGHFGMALLIWIIDALLVIFSSSAISIVGIYEIINIGLMMTFYFYLLKRQNIQLISKDIFVKILLILIHCLFAIVVVYLLSIFFLPNIPIIYRLLISGSLFYIFIITTGKKLDLNYIKPVLMLLEK